MTGAGAATGALWGGLIGLIFFVPLFGMAVGAATGAATGAMSDYGVDDKFMKELGAQLEPGGAAVILLVRKVSVDKVLPEDPDRGQDHPDVARHRAGGAARGGARRRRQPLAGTLPVERAARRAPLARPGRFTRAG